MKLRARALKIALSVALAIVVWPSCFSGELQAQNKTEPRFVVERIVIEGNTILGDAELNAFRREYEGQVMTLADAQQMARALEGKYRSRGYETTMVLIPEQSLADRTLKLRVMEGRVGTVLIEGCKYFGAEHNYRPYLPRKGDLLNIKELDDSLRVLNAHPDKYGRAVLQKGTVERTTDIRLEVHEERPFHFSLGLDNTGTGNTPRLRTLLTLQYDNFFDRSQIGIFQFTTSPEDLDMVRQYAASYSIPLGPLGGPIGHSLTAYGAYSDVESEMILDLLKLEGKGSVLGAQYAFPLPEVLTLRHQISIGMEWHKIEDIIGFGRTKFKDEVRKMPLVARWSGVLVDRHGATDLWLGLRYQKDGLLYDFDEQKYERVRTDADEDFLSATAGVQRQHSLGAGWVCSVGCQGQLTGDRLLPSEHYGLGGYNTVRGYRYRVITVDEAFNVRAEIWTPTLPRFLPEDFRENIRLLAFLDGAWGRNRHAAPGELDYENMAGAGFGLRASLFDSALTARVDAGWALNDLEATEKDERGDLVVHFGIVCRF